MNKFYFYHPTVSALYFFSVLFMTMFTSNPVLLIFAIIGSISFSATFEKKTVFLKNLMLYFLFFIIIALANPLFSHNGVTPLFFINGNAITLEAILYGFDIAVMLISVMYWFKCFNFIFTSDKILYLTSRISPKISLLFSSALRFIPLFREQAGKIKQVHKAMGLYSSDSWSDNLRSIIKVFSALLTWSIENAIDTGSSMKCRGYGLKNRSRFSLFHITLADVVLLTLILVLDIIVITCMACGKLDFRFYPKITFSDLDVYSIIAFAAFGILSFLPIILEIKENVSWKYYRSKI